MSQDFSFFSEKIHFDVKWHRNTLRVQTGKLEVMDIDYL